ncbi:uncharacterized protein V1510DRAFT_399460 [Dipodascopsis tothii]|uniref:uncharacterized protein n=1 Tax=Dipodascopsis tothii TaxID=44089 RepID=UPI0034CD0202
MRASIIARRTPLIRFLGKRVYPENVDHSPKLHPQDPHKELPASFAQYRLRAIQHGPLATGGASFHSSSIAPADGEVFSRSQLPSRYRYIELDMDEIDTINSGGAAPY